MGMYGQKEDFFMTKRIIAGLLTVGILGGLAYYSGTLYSEHAGEEDLLSL